MRETLPTLYGIESSSMRSRDPDGVNLGDHRPARLDPDGSCSLGTIPGPTDSLFSSLTTDTELETMRQQPFDVLKLVGAPPPPPKIPPPKRSKKLPQKGVSLKMSVPEYNQGNDENDENVANLCTPRENVKASSVAYPAGKPQNDSPREEDDDDDLRSFITIESNTIDVDDYSFASRSVMGDVENMVKMIPPSPASEMTRPHSNKKHEDSTAVAATETTTPSVGERQEQSRKPHRRGFFGKLFRGKKKDKSSHSHMDMIVEATSQESNADHEHPPVEKDAATHKPHVEELRSSIDVELDVSKGRNTEDRPSGDMQSSQEDPAPDVPLVQSDDFNEGSCPESSKPVKRAKKFTQDPPDDKHGDPPLYSGPPLISPTSANRHLFVSISEEEEEQSRIDSVRSRIAEAYDGHQSEAVDNSIRPIPSALSCNDASLYGGDISIVSSLCQRPSIDPEADGVFPRLPSTKASIQYQEGLQSTPSNMSQLRVLVQAESVDPVGISPTIDEDIRGRTEACEVVYQDPVGESPMAWKIWNDPVGESPCHEEDLKNENGSFNDHDSLRSASKDPPLEWKAEEKKRQEDSTLEDDNQLGEQGGPKQKYVEGTSKATREALDLQTCDADLMKAESVTSEQWIERVFDEATPELLKDTKENPLSVTGAAFSNAETIAYLHELNGEPSPRHTWHSSRLKTVAVLESPVSIRTKTSKEILKEKLKEKYALAQEAARRKAVPSPNDYTAENLENMADREPTREERFESKHISKFQGFGFKSKFKDRKPTKKKDELKLVLTETKVERVISLRTADHRVGSLGKLNETSSTELLVVSQPGRIAVRAVARGLKIRREKAESASIVKSQGRNRFNFRIPEAEIKDPIQRASRRLLSKAAVKIQSAARLYLGKREAVDRMWAILALQSYFRRWNCEASLRDHIHSVTALQSVARAWFARQEAKKQNNAAVQIQKNVRVYLAGVRLYDMMYCLVSIQALFRGAYVRKKKAEYDAELMAKSDYAIPLQSLIRGFKARKELQSLNYSACKLQTIWRSYVARIDLQFQIVDIIVVQSIGRRWLACRQARALRNAPLILPATKIQGRWRGYSARSLHKKMLAARKIQTAWRAFHAYTDYVFALVDILVVQRTMRQWLAKRQVKKLREEKVAAARREEEKLKNASVTIQKAWRGFWAFSQFIIAQYEVTRLQAIVRGKLARQRYHLKLGCTIIIQATVRQYLSKKAVNSMMVADALVAANAQNLRERNSAKRIQFWWRIVLDWTREKRAALVIERFFIRVKRDVRNEVGRKQWKASMKRRNQKRRESEGARLRPLPLPMCGGLGDVEEQSLVLYNSSKRGSKSSAAHQRSQSAPRPRSRHHQAPLYRTPSAGVGERRTASSSLRRSESRDGHDWPVESVLQLTASNETDVSGITTPEILQRAEKGGFNRRPRERRNADEYIKKYNNGESSVKDSMLGMIPKKQVEPPVSSPKSRQHFFSEDHAAPPRIERTSSLGKQGSMPPKRRASSATPRGHRMPPSPHRMSPSPHRRPPSPHRRPPSPHRGMPPPRREYRGMPSPRKERSPYYSPVAFTRQHGVIKRDETAETDSMSRSTTSRHSRSSSHDRLDRSHRNPAMESNNKDKAKYSPRHPVGERHHSVVYLGPDYGEV